MTLYAAYGSNLDPRRMAQRAPSSPVRGSGWLRGWRLTFAGEDLGWDGALSTVVEDDAASVFVMLYEVAAHDERALDAWEGVDLGLWTKIKVRVQTMGRHELAWIYVLDAYEGGLPSAHYLGVLAEAAEAGGAPADYVERLRLMPCRSIDASD
ncbi:MAG: gamma-glutamylcyclotransferase [Actinomycetes bacterium]